MDKRILVAVDGSDESRAASEVTCSLAEQSPAKTILVCATDRDIPEDVVNAAINEGIVRPSDSQTFARTLEFLEISATRAQMTREAILSRTATVIAQEIIKDEKGFAEDHNVKEIITLVRGGVVSKAILQAANEKSADLAVVGSHNREGLDALMHPSVAEAARKDTLCPTMVLFQVR